MFQRYMPLVREIYKKFSGKNDLPGKPKFMYLDEFTDLFNEARLSTDHFGSREINSVFSTSQETSIVELERVDHL
jgi:hypothetical protein